MSRVISLKELSHHLMAERLETSVAKAAARYSDSDIAAILWLRTANAARALLNPMAVFDSNGQLNKTAVRSSLVGDPTGYELEAELKVKPYVPNFSVYASDPKGRTVIEEFILANRAILGREHPRILEAEQALLAFDRYDEWVNTLKKKEDAEETPEA